MCDRIDEALLERGRRVLRRNDAVLGAVIRRVGACDLKRHGDPYRYLVRCVVHQQITGKAAAAIEARLKSAFGGRVPAPARLRAAAVETLRGAGLSRQKIASLHAIASAFDDRVVDSRRLSRLDEGGVVELVTQIRGVGEWTAHMLLMFSLGRPDILPVGDYGVRKAARDLYGLADLPKRKELEAIGERWRPYRSLATWYLWRSLDPTAP